MYFYIAISNILMSYNALTPITIHTNLQTGTNKKFKAKLKLSFLLFETIKTIAYFTLIEYFKVLLIAIKQYQLMHETKYMV